MASDTGTSLHDRPVIPVLTSGGTASEPFPAHLGKRYLPQPSVHRRNDLQSSHRRCLSSSSPSILPLVIDLVRVPPTVPSTVQTVQQTSHCFVPPTHHARAVSVPRAAHSSGDTLSSIRHRNASSVPCSSTENTRLNALLDYLDGVKSRRFFPLFLPFFFFFFFLFSFSFLHTIRSQAVVAGSADHVILRT